MGGRGKRDRRWVWVVGVGMFVVGVVLWLAQGPVVGAALNGGKQVVLAIPDFRNGSVEELDKGANDLVEAHHQVVGGLIRELERPGLSNAAQVRIVYILGELRDPAAVDVLIENINLRDEGPREPNLRLPRWFTYPARDALRKLGSYAESGIIGIIGSKKFDEKKVDGYAAVIMELEGLHYGEERLQRGIAGGGDETTKKHYEMVIERLKHPRTEPTQ